MVRVIMRFDVYLNVNSAHVSSVRHVPPTTEFYFHFLFAAIETFGRLEVYYGGGICDRINTKIFWELDVSCFSYFKELTWR